MVSSETVLGSMFQ